MQIEVKGKFQNTEDHIGRQAMYETVKGISVCLGSDISVAAQSGHTPCAASYIASTGVECYTDGRHVVCHAERISGVNQEITVTAAIYHREAGQQSFDKMFDIPKTLVISVQETTRPRHWW